MKLQISWFTDHVSSDYKRNKNTKPCTCSAHAMAWVIRTVTTGTARWSWILCAAIVVVSRLSIACWIRSRLLLAPTWSAIVWRRLVSWWWFRWTRIPIYAALPRRPVWVLTIGTLWRCLIISKIVRESKKVGPLSLVLVLMEQEIEMDASMMEVDDVSV